MMRVLLTHLLSWSNVARLARAFHDIGADVSVLAPAGHPVHGVRAVSRSFLYRPLTARASFRAAIKGADPDLIVPCDECSLDTLRSLRMTADAATAERIDRSLGRPVATGEGAFRAGLIDYVGEAGIAMPAMTSVASLAALRGFVERVGLPVVLKLDGSWGGRDVLAVETYRTLSRAYARLQLRNGAIWRAKRLILDAEPVLAMRWGRREMTAQAFVKGPAANIAFACWRGEVLAHVAVEALITSSRFGVSTVIRPLAHEGMIAAARGIARRLDLSGIHGLDFILDSDGQAQLIEINLRATQTAHLVLAAGQDLPAALVGAHRSQAVEPRPAVAASEIALFPQEWQRDGNSQWLTRAYHDTPVKDPELLAHYGYPLDRAKAERAAHPWAVAKIY